MAPATQPHTRIPSGSAIPSTPRRFVVEVVYRGTSTSTIAEVPIRDTVFDRVVGDIVSGQHAHVVRVFELRDVTREIAAAVAQKLEDDGELTESQEMELAPWLGLYGFQVPDNGQHRNPGRDPDELRERQFDYGLWG